MNNFNESIYKTIIDNLGVEIFVTDGEGKVLFVNPASIEINELDVKNIVGRDVRDLEKDGYFSESSTLRVIKAKESVSVIQTLKSGKRVIASGFPIFDDDGKINLVFTTSQDIEAVNNLFEELDQQRVEIASLKKALSKNSGLDANDPESIKVKETLERVASLDLPLLISGESGTGKQVAARHVHFSGKRCDKPFFTVNCCSADDGFLNKEIFGSETSQGGNDSRRIKQGKLDFADEGTLVLNNISYMPMELQAKLFRYIDTGRFIRSGGSTEVKSTARIIATTGMDIESLSHTDMFMKALYYRLNTIPIHIPPLRNRPLDIPFLANQYISIFNEKYKAKKILSKDALGTLASHSWPGNLIELNQTIESAYIMSDGPMIRSDTIHDILHGHMNQEEPKSKVYCEDIIPLKEAKHLLEEQLVKRAYSIYKTTHKTAEVLGVNQSTISRILNKY